MKCPSIFIFLALSIPLIASAQSPVPDGAILETIATGFQFVEGPVWKDGAGLLFSDMKGNRIYKWTPAGGTSVFRDPSGNSNGLTYDAQGRLIMNQTGYRRVARLESDGTETVLASSYQGKKLNSPNDVVIKSDGSIYFTDPPFNIPTGQKQELSFSGIFRISPSGTLQLLDASLALPNGICFSQDETKLYVNNSQERVIYVWDIVNDSTIANKRRFASITPTGYADGMKMDAQGNIFCAGPLGVWVFSPNGTLLDTILVPSASNCNWGDAAKKTLYITGGTAVYRLRMTTTGIRDQEKPRGGTGASCQNFPNPFNPSTKIRYQLAERGRIDVRVYDARGRWITTLLDGVMEMGSHELSWNATAYPSGIYFLRLTQHNESGMSSQLVNKMILAK